MQLQFRLQMYFFFVIPKEGVSASFANQHLPSDSKERKTQVEDIVFDVVTWF